MTPAAAQRQDLLLTILLIAPVDYGWLAWAVCMVLGGCGFGLFAGVSVAAGWTISVQCLLYHYKTILLLSVVCITNYYCCNRCCVFRHA